MKDFIANLILMPIAIVFVVIQMIFRRAGWL